MSFTIGVGIAATLLLIAAGYFVVSQFNKNQAQKQIMHLEELFWQRRARTPLLIEILKRHRAESEISKSLISLRNELSRMHGCTRQEIELERKYTKMIEEILHQARSNASLKSEAVFLALSKELTEIEVNINSELQNIKAI